MNFIYEIDYEVITHCVLGLDITRPRPSCVLIFEFALINILLSTVVRILNSNLE